MSINLETYKNILDHSLILIDHCMEKCTCGGKITTITTPYFYGNFGNDHCLKHDMTKLKNFIGDDTPVNNYPNLSYHFYFGCYFSVESWNAFKTLLDAGESFTFN